ncbi:MAG: restriction endonuclease subunit S [Candidatus Pacebacteria bacterium]|nr:restriction endonuclease subunit S [Candidatus Paceibacterota bacterium]
MQSKYFAKQTQIFQVGRSGMPKINQDQLSKIKIPLPPIEIQKQIVARLDKEMETLEKIRELKTQAEERINKILEEVWGE